VSDRRADWRELAAIFLGGAIGGVLRVWLGVTFASGTGHWPWVIFLVNVTGSVALAYFVTRLQERLPLSTYRRPLVGTGFCGAYTTFSTMQVEVLAMLDRGHVGLAIGYSTASLVVGCLAIWTVTAMVRRTRVIA
jgi:CrcB protein